MSTEPLPLPIKGWLVNHRIGVSSLAERLGVSVTHLSEVLNRKRPLSKSLALSLVHELGLDPSTSALLLGPPERWGRGRWPTTPTS